VTVKFLFSPLNIESRLLSAEKVTNINDYTPTRIPQYRRCGALKLSGNTRIVNIGNGLVARTTEYTVAASPPGRFRARQNQPNNIKTPHRRRIRRFRINLYRST